MQSEGLMRIAQALLACCCCWALGCGAVGEPRPPLLNIPEQPASFNATQEADQAQLRWIWPTATTGGELLCREISVFEVFAVDVEAGSQPSPEVVEQLGSAIARLDTEKLTSQPGGVVSTTASLRTRYGKRTAIAVRARTTKGKTSPWSQVAVLNVVRPAMAPTALKVDSRADGLELQWNPSEGAAAYVVEKKLEGSDGFVVAGRAASTSYLDRSIVWGSEHTYRVAAEVSSDTGNVLGPRSEEASTTAVDTFPPMAPSGLRAVVTEESVELTWAANSTHDLAGYRLLRDGKPGHPGLLKSPTFSDKVEPGRELRTYAVVAVDLTGNESAPSEPIEVQFR